ncbi:protein NTM1-like 9 isoform X2 [Jatropha curcas]|uniref:protein NTM1-like 9 isoform X2 n=1 Tax=Jatropha curcas TaxID=180498 RepID=UPI0009D7017B|nr:protein NTM1-like 9 isoform X2 [Jatropha curcas]
MIMNPHLDAHLHSNPPGERFRLPHDVGYRFHPSDEEIVSYFLYHKMNGEDFLVDHIVREIDLCQNDPWDIPDLSGISSDDPVWHFFSRIDYKHSHSKRANRRTKAGFWKSTGKVRRVKAKQTGEEIGSKRTLVFYVKLPDSETTRTNWVIHEYKSKTILPEQRDFVFCRLKHKTDEEIDNSVNDEGEPSRPVDADVENHAVQTDAEQAPQSHVSVTRIEEISNEHTSCRDNQHIGLNFHDTSEDDVDPIKLADSFLSLDQGFSEESELILPHEFRPPKLLNEGFIEDRSDLEMEVGHGKLPCCFISLWKPIQALGQASTASVAAARPLQINYIGSVGRGESSIYEHRANEGIIQDEVSAIRPGKISCTDKPSHGEEKCYLDGGYGQDKYIYCLQEFPTFSKPIKIGGFNLSVKKRCQFKPNKQPANQKSNVRSAGAAGSDKEISSICSETASIHSPTPASVYIVNVLVGLLLFILTLREILILH